MLDSVKLNSKGIGYVTGEKALIPGQYFLYFPNTKSFDILIDEDQKFFIRNNADEFVSEFKAKGSVSNKLMAAFYKKIDESNKDINRIRLLQTLTKNADSVKIYKAELDKKFDEQRKLQAEILAGDSKIFFYSWMKSSFEPPLPENISKKDTAAILGYYRDHYLDNIDFSDNRLIRTDNLYRMINQYLTNIIFPHYDSINRAVDQIIEKASPDKEMKQFITEHMMGYFAVSKYMTHKNVFVHLAEKYYFTGIADWVEEEKLKKIRERVQSIKPTMVDQIAPDLEVFRNDMSPFSLHELVADYTILFIYEPECGHCREATPQIKKIAEDYWSKGVEVFAMYSLIDKPEWDKFIEEQGLEEWNNVFDPYRTTNFYDLYNVITTPRIFLLDKDKKIILSDVGVEQIRDFLKLTFKK